MKSPTWGYGMGLAPAADDSAKNNQPERIIMSNSPFAVLVNSEIYTSEVEEGAYIDGYAAGNENGYTEGWNDAHDDESSLSKVIANQDLMIETQSELIKLLQARLNKQASFAKAFMDDTDNI